MGDVISLGTEEVYSISLQGSNISKEIFGNIISLSIAKEFMKENNIANASIICGNGGSLSSEDTRTIAETGDLTIVSKSTSM